MARGNSRLIIERKLEDLEEQKNQGYITPEEYDALRIRYERKLGNREAVSKLQKNMGFQPSNIVEKKAKKDELYDDFVDKFSAVKSETYSEMERSTSLSKSTSRKLLLIFVVLAFAVGIFAGVTALSMGTNETTNTSNVTVIDSAFSLNTTVLSANTTNNTTKQVSTKTKTKKKTYTKSSNYSSSNSSGSGSSSSGSSYSSSSSGSSSSNSGSYSSSGRSSNYRSGE